MVNQGGSFNPNPSQTPECDIKRIIIRTACHIYCCENSICVKRKMFLWDTAEEMDTLKQDSIHQFRDETLLGVLENSFSVIYKHSNWHDF